MWTASSTGGGALGSAGNARSWRWQKCSELAYLQSAPTGLMQSALPEDEGVPARDGRYTDGSDVPLRSPRLTLDKLLAQCDGAFGAGTSSALRKSNAKFNKLYGGADPRTATLPVAAAATSVFYLDFSDDPWAAASVRGPLGPPSLTLSYCMTTCDGCGHCGAGVPANLTACDEAADRFVDEVLRGWARVPAGSGTHASLTRD